ncbi:unnamed protein product, partial [Rotaria sp. Silwood2]
FPLDSGSHSDEWEDIDDIDDDDAIDVNENLIDAASNLISDEDEEGDDDDSNQNNDTSRDDSSSDEFESNSDDDISFSSLIIHDNKTSSIDHYELLTSIFHLMKKIRAAIKFIRNHNITNEYVLKQIKAKKNAQNIGGQKIGGLVLDMMIRWNSSCLLLDRLVMHKDIVKNIFSFPNNLNELAEKEKKKLHELTIKQNEWDMLVNLQQVLEPFSVSTTILSGQHYPTIASSFHIWRLLLRFLNTTSDDEPTIVALKESLRFQFNLYCNSKLPPGQLEIMQIAAFLDPVIYKLLTDDDRKSAKKVIFKKLKNVAASSIIIPSFSTQRTTANTSISNPLQKLAMICGQAVPVATTTVSTRSMTLDEEISGYIEATQSDVNFQEFWVSHEKSFPRLSRLVRRINIIPATSVASEALFSTASFLNRKHRSALSSRTLRYLLILKNRHLLDKLEQKY